MATTQHWLPKRDAMASISDGSATAAELIETLSAPASSSACASSALLTPPPMVSGMARPSRILAHRLVLVAAALGRRRDVEDDDLVRPLALVFHGQGHGIAGVPDPLEADALDHPAVADVEAGDDALGQHQPSSRKRDSRAAP
jgi:hypothetical protein